MHISLAKKPCKHCGSMERRQYASTAICQCRYVRWRESYDPVRAKAKYLARREEILARARAQRLAKGVQPRKQRENLLAICTIEEARGRGRRFYFLGEACKRGHKAPRLVQSRRCYQCYLDSQRKRRQAKHRYRVRHPVIRLLRGAKTRSRNRHIIFALTRKDLVLPTHCPVLGIELDYSYGTKRGVVQPNSPSLDRLDASQGYVPGNVHVISSRANTIKNNATPEEIFALAAYLERVHPRCRRPSWLLTRPKLNVDQPGTPVWP